MGKRDGGKIRVGMIGVGGNAQGHIRRLLDDGRAEIVALCDISEESLERTVGNFPQFADVPQFARHKKMLADVEMDAVEISTAHTAHYSDTSAQELRRRPVEEVVRTLQGELPHNLVNPGVKDLFLQKWGRD